MHRSRTALSIPHGCGCYREHGDAASEVGRGRSQDPRPATDTGHGPVSPPLAGSATSSPSNGGDRLVPHLRPHPAAHRRTRVIAGWARVGRRGSRHLGATGLHRGSRGTRASGSAGAAGLGRPPPRRSMGSCGSTASWTCSKWTTSSCAAPANWHNSMPCVATTPSISPQRSVQGDTTVVVADDSDLCAAAAALGLAVADTSVDERNL